MVPSPGGRARRPIPSTLCSGKLVFFESDTLKVAVGCSPALDLPNVSFVNSIATLRGGSHFNFVIDTVLTRKNPTTTDRQAEFGPRSGKHFCMGGSGERVALGCERVAWHWATGEWR